jgi:FMN phosphatase YigB (HAD superfamily)
MIKNIVFDLGNVLLSFRPEEFLTKKNYAEDYKQKILSDIFRSKEWLLLDNGDINLNEAIDLIASRSSFKKEEIASVFNLRAELMYPLSLNVDLLPDLSKRGFRLFYLSNFPIDIYEEIKAQYSFFKYFDGGLISAEIKFSKPDTRIFEILTEKYLLKPKETLFIDDLEINVKGAEKTGMKGLVTFGSPDISKDLENSLI